METFFEKSVPFDVKVRLESRSFEGYCSTFGNMDLVGDIIEHGAFRKTISERGPNAANKIKILWNHHEPFGMPVEMREDANGLFVVGKAADTQENKDRLTYMAEGVVDSMSIGFTIPDGKSWWEEDDASPYGMVRHITEAKLYEFSPVTFPANEQAAISNVRKHLELNSLLKSFGKEDLMGAARELKNAEGSVVDEAIAALTELKARLNLATPSDAPGVGQPSTTAGGVVGTSSIGAAEIRSGAISTTTTNSPIVTGTAPSGDGGDASDTDPEVKEALQSVLDEITLGNVLRGLR